MISIIICSVKPDLLETVKLSISATIGCEYELIALDNRNNQYSIFSAYNSGASKAKYDILCFIHEDIEFFSKNWGPALVEVFAKDNTVGLVGSCGSTVKTELPTSWIDVPSEFYISGLVKSPLPLLQEAVAAYREVVVVDGLFMATTKQVWKESNFPTWEGFHGYDLILSLLIGQLRKIVVMDGLAILHKSGGSFNARWFDVTLKIHQNFKESLPRMVIDDKNVMAAAYAKNALKFIQRINTLSDRSRKVFLIFKYLVFNPRIRFLYKLRALYYWLR